MISFTSRLTLIAAFLLLVNTLAIFPAAAATMDELSAKVRDPQAEPSAREIAATELAKQFPQSHAQFLGLFRETRLMRVQRVLLKLMIAQRMPGLTEAVATALADAEPLMRLTATEGLAGIAETSTFLNLLQKALADSDVEVRWWAVKTLASSPVALENMPEQARRFSVNPDPLMRQALLAHLSTAPTVRTLVAELITQGLLDSDPTTCISAANRAAATLFPTNVPVSAAQSTIITSLVARLAEEDAARAGAAGCALSLIMNPTVEAAVREALNSSNLLQRARAADLLRKRKLAFDPAVLADVIRRGSEAEQLYACGTLARVQSTACVPLVLAALKSSHATVRQSAVYALEVIPDSAPLAALIGALQNDDANVRYRAAVVLGRRPESGLAVEALRNVANTDSDAKVRGAAKIAAINAAGGDLTSVLVDPDTLRHEAKQLAAARFGNSAGQPTLIENGIALVGSQKQLFVDDLVIADLGGAERRMHRFRKDVRNPVLEQQFSWELMGPASYCTTVRYDPETKLFSFWYTSFGRISQAGEAIASRAQCLALSTDGIEWQRPKLGQHPFGTSADSNMVGRAPNIVFNPAEQDAARRFASYAYVPARNGMAVSFSPDGIGRWTDWKFVCGGGNDVVTACRDDLNPGTFSFMKWRIGRWFRRAAWPAWGATPETIKRGLINVTATFADDRLAMQRIAATYPGLDAFQPEMIRSEIYEVTPFIYEGIYFGLPVRFDISGRGGGNVDGPTDLALMFSRDKNGHGGWLRPGTANYLVPATNDELEQAERGKTPLTGVLDLGRWGEWDATQHYGPSSLLVIDDEIVLYYTGGSFGHEPEGSRSDGAGKNVYRMAIGRATLRLDGMVSLRAGGKPVQVTTMPLVFKGTELVVNADSSQGRLQVELLDANGQTIATAEPISSDSVRHRVRWPDSVELTKLAGQRVELRFHFTNTDLYAFQFQ